FCCSAIMNYISEDPSGSGKEVPLQRFLIISHLFDNRRKERAIRAVFSDFFHYGKDFPLLLLDRVNMRLPGSSTAFLNLLFNFSFHFMQLPFSSQVAG